MATDRVDVTGLALVKESSYCDLRSGGGAIFRPREASRARYVRVRYVFVKHIAPPAIPAISGDRRF